MVKVTWSKIIVGTERTHHMSRNTHANYENHTSDGSNITAKVKLVQK